MKNDKDRLTTVDGCKKEFIKLIEGFRMKYGVWQVFVDFLEMSAIAISNQCDLVRHDEREARYMEIVNQYTHDEVQTLAEMLGIIMSALNLCIPYPRDILGELFHALELQDKWKGQLFSPQHICDFMGAIQTAELVGNMPEKGYVTVCEPCVGAGAMLFGFAHALTDDGFDYTKHMVATATDIDIKCVHMAYIQLSLYGIPAVVIHGDSLAMKQWSYWLTPGYVFGGWENIDRKELTETVSV